MYFLCSGLVGLVRRQNSGNQYPSDQGPGQEPGTGTGLAQGQGQGHHGNYSPSSPMNGSGRGGSGNGGSGGNGGGSGGGNGCSFFAGLGTNHHRRGMLSSIGTYTSIPLR